MLGVGDLFANIKKAQRWGTFRLVLLLTTMTAGTTQAIDNDKMVHMAVSYGLSYTGMQLTKPEHRWLPPLLTFAAGILKECLDDHFDGKDVLANGIGVGASIIVIQF